MLKRKLQMKQKKKKKIMSEREKMLIEFHIWTEVIIIWWSFQQIFKSSLKRKEFKLTRDYITANFNGNEIIHCKEHTWGCRSSDYYVARTMKIKPENTTSWRKKEKVVFITKFFWLKFISFKLSIFKRLTKNVPM